VSSFKIYCPCYLKIYSTWRVLFRLNKWVHYCDLGEKSGNPIMTFPIKKRIQTELFIDGKLVLMGPDQKILTRAGSGQFFVARVGSGQPFMVWGWFWKISPKNVKFFNFFPLDKKNLSGSGQKVPRSKAGQPLFYFGSKVSSGRVGSGQGPSLETRNFMYTRDRSGNDRTS